MEVVSKYICPAHRETVFVHISIDVMISKTSALYNERFIYVYESSFHFRFDERDVSFLLLGDKVFEWRG